jgi:menaquinone-9 beta-reductase
MWDAIVVGAGPGGSAAAYYLARRGRRVLLLDRQAFPRDKSCGDGLTRPAVSVLDEMGVLPELGSAQRVRGVRMHMRGQPHRDLLYPRDSLGLVVPRLQLDDILCRRAVFAGAELRTGVSVARLVREDGLVCGVEAIEGSQIHMLRSAVVIAADGASSVLARDAGLLSRGPVGFAIRGYYEGIAEFDDLLEIRMPLLDSTDEHLLPSYGWIFPTGTGTANIGVGLCRRERGANVRQMMERFVGELRQSDRRFENMHLREPWKGAPLRFDFAPDRCAAAGLMLVGDAAGLISPFTGEGISFALESGRCAAEVADEAMVRRETRDLSEYGRRLGARHAGYFELGRESIRRFVLLWHVLEDTFHNDSPLFALTREAALFPESVGESYISVRLPDVREDVGSLAPALRADLVAASDILGDAVRGDWPNLTRLAAIDRSNRSVPFRPGLLLLLSAMCGGAPHPHAPALAAAVELGYLSTLAQLSILDESPLAGNADRSANWANRFAVVVADFLMMRAYEISARSGAGVTQVITRTMAKVCESRVRELRRAREGTSAQLEYDQIARGKTGAMLELPCLLGARLGMLSVEHTGLLGDFGCHLGVALQIVEDVRDASGQPRQFSLSGSADPQRIVRGLPLVLALERDDVGPEVRSLLDQPKSERTFRLLADILKHSGVLDDAFDSAIGQRSLAMASLEGLPVSAARNALSTIAERIVRRTE